MKICGINGMPIFCFALLVLVCVVLSPVPEKLPSGLQNKATYLNSAWKLAYGDNKTLLTGIKSGFAGSLAGFLQVLCFMWARTVMNVQYANGGDFSTILIRLWNEGGLMRLYRGLAYALVQNPLSRFGDIGANSAGSVYFRESKINVFVQTATTTLLSSLWRVFMTPIDFLKTNMQVHGNNGLIFSLKRGKREGFTIFWSGSLAILLSNWAGSYPWFTTYNVMQIHVPKFGDGARVLYREALIGCCSSIVSDVCTNSIRVVKTITQVKSKMEYKMAIGEVLRKDGLIGIFARGIKTRLAVNAAQSILFTVLWKYIEGQGHMYHEEYTVVRRKNTSPIPGKQIIWNLDCPKLPPETYRETKVNKVNSFDVLTHALKRLENVKTIYKPFNIQLLCGILPQVVYESIIFPTRDEMFGSITSLIGEKARCYSKSFQSNCDILHRKRCKNDIFLHDPHVNIASIKSLSSHPCYCQSELWSLLYGKKKDVVPKELQDVNHLPINFESHVRTMSDDSLHSLRMMHGSFFSESFERRLFQKLGLPYYGRTAYERSSRIFHESYSEFTSINGNIHSDGIFLVTLQIYFPNESEGKDYYGTCFHDAVEAKTFYGERERHGHWMRVNKSECTYKIPYEKNSGYAFATGKNSFHSAPDVCQNLCCPFNRQAIIFNWKKSSNYMKLRLQHEKKILAAREKNIIKYFNRHPKLGFGVAQDMKSRVKDVARYVKDALNSGFRHIDTSNYYGTEQYISEGIKYSGVHRNEIFITAKYMPNRNTCEMDYDSTIKAFNETIRQLDMDYVDLYMIHIPGFTKAQLNRCRKNQRNFEPKLTNKIRRREVWRAMEILYKEGRVRALGVSNFSPEHLDNILEAAEILPSVNQINFTPFYHNEDWWTHNMANGILLTSFSSARAFLDEKPESARMNVLKDISNKYGKSPLQIFQRWIIEREVNVLTSSTTFEHQQENLNILNFKLSHKDIMLISELGQNEEGGLHMRVD